MQMGSPRRIGRQIIAASVAALVVSLPSVASAQGPGPVLVVGDSLEVGTEPYLRQELGGVQLDVDAKTSRPSSDGLAVLQGALGPEHEVVVFDLGTNDDPSNPDGLAANLETAAADRRWPLPRLRHDQPPAAERRLRRRAERRRRAGRRRAGARIADWRSVASRPGVLQPDGVHATASGYALRASIVADAIRSCSGGGGSPGGGGGRAEDAAAEARRGPGAARARPGLRAARRAGARDRRPGAVAILGFARGAVAAFESALDSAFDLGERRGPADRGSAGRGVAPGVALVVAERRPLRRAGARVVSQTNR